MPLVSNPSLGCLEVCNYFRTQEESDFELEDQLTEISCGWAKFPRLSWKLGCDLHLGRCLGDRRSGPRCRWMWRKAQKAAGFWELPPNDQLFPISLPPPNLDGNMKPSFTGGYSFWWQKLIATKCHFAAVCFHFYLPAPPTPPQPSTNSDWAV